MVQLVNLELEGLLVRQQLSIVLLELDVFVQHLGILPGHQVNGLLEPGEHAHLALLPGDQPGHQGPDESPGKRPHEQVGCYFPVHCGSGFS